MNKVKLNDKDCILVGFEGDDISYLAFGLAYVRVGDKQLLKEFIEKGRKVKRINFAYTNINKEEILKKLSLVNKNNELLSAGYILFAKEAKLEMQVAIFATETKLTFLDIDQVCGVK